jgi:hypothetical protein
MSDISASARSLARMHAHTHTHTHTHTQIALLAEVQYVVVFMETNKMK